MSELPKYIREGINFTDSEMELLIGALCRDLRSIKDVERYISRRIVEYEFEMSVGRLNDIDRCAMLEWIEIEKYFIRFKNSFNREYYGII